MAKAKMLFGAAAARDILGLTPPESVERLVIAGVLEISAYTVRGAPLFAADSLRRAADRVVRADRIVREDAPAAAPPRGAR